MQRHIAFDIGAKGLALEWEKSGHSGVCSIFTIGYRSQPWRKRSNLVMQLYDGTIIPASQAINNLEIERRLDLFYRPIIMQ